MHLHILGIGGTFMSALAILAREAGYQVTGNDINCYPPISDLLAEKQIDWTEGYDVCEQALSADVVIVGNVIKRGMPVIEAVLNAKKPYISGPQWLAEHILPKYRVIAVAGTHGKTTTTSMLAFILHEAGLSPGFLIGGVAQDFKTSALLGTGEWFVIEADEYDSAFFDKRPKFMHYRPDIAILNNLEFDHADIYPNLEAIKQQFHYLLRTIPNEGLVIKPAADKALQDVVDRGLYSGMQTFSIGSKADWWAELVNQTGESFRIWHQTTLVAEVNWSLIGQFNVENGLAAFIASIQAGVKPEIAAKALERFTPVKRRLEVKYSDKNTTIYDDFAHHPTAIAKTIRAIKQSGRHRRILVVMEFASYTMRTGVHAHEMVNAFADADKVYVLNPREFNLYQLTKEWPFSHELLDNNEKIVAAVKRDVRVGDGIVVMSNRGFGAIHQQLEAALLQEIQAGA